MLVAERRISKAPRRRKGREKRGRIASYEQLSVAVPLTLERRSKLVLRVSGTGEHVRIHDPHAPLDRRRRPRTVARYGRDAHPDLDVKSASHNPGPCGQPVPSSRRRDAVEIDGWWKVNRVPGAVLLAGPLRALSLP